MTRVRRWGLGAAFAAVAVVTPGALSQPPLPKQPIRIKASSPKPEPVADTKLLMDALTSPNFNGLNKLLKDQPKEADAWGFARGQALIVAEAANLLMLRPPKANAEAQDLWLTRAADLRDAASKLALAAAGQDFLKARAGLVEVANACNRCHQSFRVAARVAPFGDE